MQVYITKYALTSGIFLMEVESISEDGKTVYGKDWRDCYHGPGRDWHLTWNSALKRAEAMRQKKLLSLQKQMQVIRDLKFEDPAEK